MSAAAEKERAVGATEPAKVEVWRDEEGDARLCCVIPSVRAFPRALIDDVVSQTVRPGTFAVVRDVRPNGRARNLGVRAAVEASDGRAEIAILIDDDARLAHERVIERLVDALAGPDGPAVVGGAKLLPPGASAFARRVAREVPRAVQAEPAAPVESNPGQRGPALSAITTTCCAVRIAALEDVGGFDETLERGVDTECFYRMRRAGHRFLFIPGAAAHHPVPGDVRALMSQWYARGRAQAIEAARHPERALGPPIPAGRVAGAAYLALRAAALVPSMFVQVSRFSRPRVRLGFRPLAALASFAAAAGYVRGRGRAEGG